MFSKCSEAGVAAAVTQVLLHLARLRHGFAQIAKCFAGDLKLVLSLHQPVLDDHVAIAAVGVDVQFVRGIDRDGVLHLLEQLLEVNDVAVILVVPVEPIGAADGLEEIVVAQLVIGVVRAVRACWQGRPHRRIRATPARGPCTGWHPCRHAVRRTRPRGRSRGRIS